MLLVGNVGSGKSTFIRYFKKVFLEKQHAALAKQCEWVFLNMNFAPLSNDEIYNWIKKELITQLQNNHTDIDFSDIEIIRKIFIKEIHIFDSGIGQLLKGNEMEYNKELYNLLRKSIDDTSSYLTSLMVFLKETYLLLPIIVLDNEKMGLMS